jgi:hypothetical protein
MANLGLVLLVFAFVAAVGATAGWPQWPRVNLIGLALAFYFAALIFGSVHPLLVR